MYAKFIVWLVGTHAAERQELLTLTLLDKENKTQKTLGHFVICGLGGLLFFLLLCCTSLNRDISGGSGDTH